MSNGDLPQLFMRHPDLTKLPPLVLPEGFTLHTHEPGMEPVWEELIEKAFGNHYAFDAVISSADNYDPSQVLYIAKNGVDIATTTATEKEWFPGEGWFRMVGVAPEARGQGAGRMIGLAALHTLAKQGYKTAVLSTDDFRIPALGLYFSLGFEPLMNHESHPARWEAVMKKLVKK